MDNSRQNGGAGYGRDMTRAERFEEEKKRIVDSCFNKKDVDGSLLETYITHIRITEYSSHPSGPAPPELRSQSEKPRVIIVAVRKSGRVRMHKSKENANGTFSIGKTWDLNDLTAIESFTGSSVDPQKREWAGDVGFVVNIGKPYYWQAQADKEKKFFIASLIKIYGKYTAGNTPELRGFDPRELEQVMGPRKPPTARGPSDPTPPPSRPETSSSRPSPVPPRPNAIPPPRDPLRPGARPPSRPERPDTASSRPEVSPSPSIPSLGAATGGFQAYQPPTSPARNLNAPNRKASPASSFDSGHTGSQPPVLRKLYSNNQSQDSVAVSATTPKSEEASSIPPRSRGGVTGPSSLGKLGEPMGPPPQVDLPDRKRPPMDPLRPPGGRDSDLVPAPLMSQGPKREPPPRSTERMSPRQNVAAKRSELSLGIGRQSPALEPEKEAPLPGTNGTQSASVTSTPVPDAPAAAEPVAEPPVPPAEKEEDEARPGLGPMIKAKKSLATAEDEEEERPGLGPMIKGQKGQRILAGALWKAASAAKASSAFKPRPGGAGQRLLEAAKNQSDEGPDGITGVVPAPPRAVVTPDLPKEAEADTAVPEVKVTLPNSSRPTSLQTATKDQERKSLEESRKEEERRRSTTGNDAKYLMTLGVDTTLLAETSAEFTKWLDHFGWVPGDRMRTRNFEEMKLDVDRELNKAQAGGWVVRFQEEDERVDAIKTGLDNAIAECDELDNLLTLYSVELSTLSDDIAYIEAQGQGLQVQAANQKLLRKELESLLDTCAITEDDLQALSMAPLETPMGLEEIEMSLVTLYKAMMKIDSSMAGMESRKSDDASGSGQQSTLNTDYGKMRIVQEKKEMYRAQTTAFLQRFGAFLSRQIDKASQETKTAAAGALSKKVDSQHHNAGRELLWQYSPLLVYARDVNLEEWNRFMKIYQEKNLPLYRSEFKEILDAWKRNARKTSADEMDVLFSAQVEKQHEGTMATARKITVKRSQTLARTLRTDKDGRGTHAEKLHDSRSLPYEVFAGILDDILPLVEMEQNFIVDFFHATTLETSDFPDLVAASKPKDRRLGDLSRHRLMEPDRELARRVTKAMEVIFSFLSQDLLNTVHWVLSLDPLQGVGVLATLERKQVGVTQSNQDFLNNILQKLHSDLEAKFSKFVEEQIRAIEDTKVKIKKRKGVISFMRVFPNFSAAVENMLEGVDTGSSVRRAVDHEYDRIIKSMFDSLKVIARENPSTLTTSGADPEDKEALNYHILLIENMNHFSEELDTHGLEILEDWKEAAAREMTEHMGLYLNAVVRRPLGKLLEYLENMETHLAAGKNITMITAQPSNSKTTFNKILSNYDGKEVRKGIESLRKRIDKHFGDADDPSLSRGLVNRVLRECEKFYNDIELRISHVVTTVYGGDILYEWPRFDVKSAFSNTGR
ncbi:exocyst complex component Sec3-domain-containing protein [Xylariomycetidae sp. FL0641]|nr:exocyst complex component Sec3-domain-containing protein [Xylariomycetidae sp. FL0641]